MGTTKKRATRGTAGRKAQPVKPYWAKPKIPVGMRLDADLVKRAKKAARDSKRPFATVVAAGMEKEILASYPQKVSKKSSK